MSLSFWEGNFSGAMLNFRWVFRISYGHSISQGTARSHHFIIFHPDVQEVNPIGCRQNEGTPTKFHEMGVSKNRGVKPPQIIHFNRVFHYKMYKPSILGYPYFWKHPNKLITPWKFNSSPLKISHAKRKGSSSNHHVSGASC